MRNFQTHRGFTLIEMAIALTILALLIGFFMGTGTAFVEARRIEGTQTKLKAIEAAFAGYVAVNGRLPCPANGTLAVTVANSGREDGDAVVGCNNNQQNGVVPWVTLGLSETDILDGWYNRITYRAGSTLVFAQGMDMTACDPAGAAVAIGTAALCSTACLASSPTTCTSPNNFLAATKGLTIVDTTIGAGNILMDATTSPSAGAAYILISHGPNGMGSFPANGAATPSSTVGAGTDEIRNANGTALQTSYVDRNLNESQTNLHFDDIVLRPSIMRVIQRAERGPRAH